PIGNFVRPLGRQMWFWLVGRLGGESSAVFHAGSLVVFLAAVALLFFLTRRLAGTVAAAAAASFLALHYPAAVPLIWACGSQDLLAITLAIAAIFAFVRGRRFLAAALLLAALLAKEAVVLAPVPALLLARRRGESWRATIVRGWPCLRAWLAWAAISGVNLGRGRFHAAGEKFAPDYPIAAIVDLVRTAVGLEWRTGPAPFARFTPPHPLMLIAIALAVVATGWLADDERRPRGA